jgi:hypothetical protein
MRVTRAPDAGFASPASRRLVRRAARRERLLELGPHMLVTMATLVSALSARGPGGRLITAREGRRLLAEARALCEMLRQSGADADGEE